MKDARTLQKDLCIYQKWLKSKSDEDRVDYVKARNSCKKIVEKAVKDSWKRYGVHLNEVGRKSPRDFFKHVNHIWNRDEPYVPTTGKKGKFGAKLFRYKALSRGRSSPDTLAF